MVSLVKLSILPILFTVLSVHTMMTAFHVTLSVVLSWFISIIMGSFFGYLLARRYQNQFRVDKKRWLIELPGTWTTLVLIMAIFISKYYFGYELSVDPSLTNNTIFEFVMLTVSGVITGLFIGRLLCYLNAFRVCASVKLTEDK